jgi:hypothetical protein
MSDTKTGVAYFHTRDPRHAGRDLDEMVEAGCTFVVHCFPELFLSYYNQATETVLRMTRDRGLEVYLDPWGVGGVFGGEAFSRFVAETPGARQVSRTGRALPAACPNHPDFRELMNLWIRRAADMGAQVCFWDEPHFHFDWMRPDALDEWACRCPVCVELYRQETGEQMPAELSPEVVAFRQRSLLGFLAENCRHARELGMRNCVCVLPDEGGPMARAAGTASWDAIAALDDVDIFGTDPYWVLFGAEVEPYVRAQCERVMVLCERHGKEAQAWLQAFLIPEGREGEVETAVRTIHAAGVRNIAAWGFRACEFIDIRCARPERVWEVITRAFRGFRGG